jgi:hypothetical protein
MAKNNSIVYYSVLSKIFPLILITPLLLITSTLTRNDFVSWFSEIGINITVESIFFTFVLSYAGAVFLIESIGNVDLKSGKPIGSVGGIFLIGAGVTLLIFAVGIFFFGYDPIADSSEFNVVLTIVMSFAIVMFVVQAREEIFHYRRFKFNATRLLS